MAKVSFGNHSAVVLPRAQQARVRRFYRDDLGCEVMREAKAGVPMQRIRPAIDVLAKELGLKYALASRRLYTDGAEVLYDYAQHLGDTPGNAMGFGLLAFDVCFSLP